VGQRRFLQALGVVGLVALGEAAGAPRSAEAAYQVGADQDVVTTNLSVQGNLVVGPANGTPTAVLTVSQETRGATTVVGIANTPRLTVAGRAVPSVVGLYSRPEVRAEAAITSLAGLVVDPSQVEQGQGEISNHFGIYVSGPTVGAQRWALYSASGANYFGGNVGIGVLAPEVALAVGSGPGLRVNGKGQVVAGGIVSSGPTILTSNDPNALAVGPQGATLPSLNVDASAPNAVTGLDVVANAAGSGLALALIGGNSNENLTVDAKGSGSLTLQRTATGPIILNRNVGFGTQMAPTAPLDAAYTWTQAPGSDIRPMFRIIGAFSAASPDTTNPDPIYAELNLSGSGDNIQGLQVAVSEWWLRNKASAGTIVPAVYAMEGTYSHEGAGTTAAAVGAQGNFYLRSGGGNVVAGSGVTGNFELTSGTVTTVTNFSAQHILSHTDTGSAKTVIGYSSNVLYATFGPNYGLDPAPRSVYGARLALGAQGGNTSGTGYNVGIQIVGNGGASPGPGGTVYNIGADIQMPSANGGGSGSSQRNFGIRITEPSPGNAGAGAFLRYALVSQSTAQSMLAGPLAVGYTNAGWAFPTPSTLYVVPTATIAATSGAVWNGLSVAPATLTLTGSTRVTTRGGVNLVNLAAPTITDAAPVTVDQAATLAIAGAPAAGGAVTLTSPIALWVQSGATRLGGNLVLDPGANVALDSNVGTQIGTVGGANGQRLAFYGASPVSQPLLPTGAGKGVDDVIAVLQLLGLARQA
jgi:hypothetical protein